MKLQDAYYEDEHGRRLGRSEIDCISVFEYHADGFFNWECSNCKKEHSSRAIKLNGTVWTCHDCQKKSLLLRTDVEYFNNVMRAAEKRDTELDKCMRRALRHIGNAVAALSPD